MRPGIRFALFLLLIPVLVVGPPSFAGADSCQPTAGLYGSRQRCVLSASDVRLLISNQSDWKYQQGPQICGKYATSESCYSPRACEIGGDTGTWYILDRAPVTATTEDAFKPYGVFCVTAEDEYDFRAVTKRRVTEEFKAVAWPSADLVVQPPDGRTLVNFPTNFYTTLTDPQTESVDIFGHTVEIEATPSGYTWRWAQPGQSKDSGSEQTSDPGAEYRAGQELAISYEYTDADVTVHPSVDVTYTGRYRVDGGEWETIDETLTVAGAPVALEIVTARVHLVG